MEWKGKTVGEWKRYYRTKRHEVEEVAEGNVKKRGGLQRNNNSE